MNIPQLAKIRQCPYMEWSRAGVRHPVGHVPWSDGVFYFLLVKAIALGLELSVGLMLPKFTKKIHDFSTFFTY